MLVQIRNAQAVGHEEVWVPFSRLKHEVAVVLQKAGYVKSLEKKNRKLHKSELPFLVISLNGSINGLKLVSKPSRRLYAGKQDLGKVRSGFGMAVVSTSKGIMSGTDARKAGMGGEVMFEIW